MRRRTKLTIVVVSIGLLFLAILIPNLLPPRFVTSQNACVNILRQIAGAKWQFAVEHGATNGTVTKEQLLPYFRNKAWPECPAGGTYVIGSIGESPKCSFPEHNHYYFEHYIEK